MCDSHFYQNVLLAKDRSLTSYRELVERCKADKKFNYFARPIYNHAISLGSLEPKSYCESNLPRRVYIREMIRTVCYMLKKSSDDAKEQARKRAIDRMHAEFIINMQEEEKKERELMNEDMTMSEEEKREQRERERRREMVRRIYENRVTLDDEMLIQRPIAMKSGGYFITRRGRRDPSKFIIDYVGEREAHASHVPYYVKITTLRQDQMLKSTIEGITNYQLLVLAGDVELNPGPKTRGGARGRRRPMRRRRPARGNLNGPAPSRLPNSVHFNSIMPARKFATLKYLDGSTVRNNPGGSFLVYSMRINDLYDPDPAILSGSVSNFKEMMQFYSYYRVLNTSIEWSVVNLELFPLSCGIVFSQTNLTGVISSLADCQNAMENDFVVPLRTISGTQGMNRTSFNVNRLRLARLLGAGLQYRAESNYTGLGLATPAIPLWANFIVFAPSGASLANGYVNNTTLYMNSEFFGRLNVRS